MERNLLFSTCTLHTHTQTHTQTDTHTDTHAHVHTSSNSSSGHTGWGGAGRADNLSQTRLAPLTRPWSSGPGHAFCRTSRVPVAAVQGGVGAGRLGADAGPGPADPGAIATSPLLLLFPFFVPLPSDHPSLPPSSPSPIPSHHLQSSPSHPHCLSFTPHNPFIPLPNCLPSLVSAILTASTFFPRTLVSSWASYPCAPLLQYFLIFCPISFTHNASARSLLTTKYRCRALLHPRCSRCNLIAHGCHRCLSRRRATQHRYSG